MRFDDDDDDGGLDDDFGLGLTELEELLRKYVYQCLFDFRAYRSLLYLSSPSTFFCSEGDDLDVLRTSNISMKMARHADRGTVLEIVTTMTMVTTTMAATLQGHLAMHRATVIMTTTEEEHSRPSQRRGSVVMTAMQTLPPSRPAKILELVFK